MVQRSDILEDQDPRPENEVDLSNSILLEQIRLRKERDGALEGLFLKVAEIDKKVDNERTEQEIELVKTVNKWKSLLYGDPKLHDKWAPGNAELTVLVNKTMQAVDSKTALPEWGIRRGKPSITVADENAEAKALFQKKRDAYLEACKRDGGAWMRKWYAECAYYSKLKRSRPRTPPDNVDHQRDPMPKPSPVRAGEHGALDVQRLMEPRTMGSVAQPPTKRKAMAEISVDGNKKAKIRRTGGEEGRDPGRVLELGDE